MPYVKIDNPKGRNAGSSAQMVNYLDKENYEKGTDKQLYFNQESEELRSDEVIKGLDENKGQLGKDQDKFYSVSTNFSQEELKYLKEKYPDKAERQAKIKEYQKEVMEEYAKNFNKGLKGDDIRYYSKIETQRKYKGTDEEVKKGLVKQGEKKPGDQTHVHTLVSRKDQSNSKKLSPLTNHKNTSKGAVQGGFNRSDFQENCEKAFDKKFEYKRDLEQSYEYRNTMKNGSLEERKEMLNKKVEQDINKNFGQQQEQKQEQKQQQQQNQDLELKRERKGPKL